MNIDFLHPEMTDAELLQVSSLGLAHIGDGVYEIMTRSYLVCHGMQTAKGLHAKTVSLVRASAQHKAAQKIMPVLNEGEQDVFRRARNTKLNGIPKAASRCEYSHATALEALFGWLYLKKQYDRLNELYTIISEDFEI